jgi:hypothetical protein
MHTYKNVFLNEDSTKGNSTWRFDILVNGKGSVRRTGVSSFAIYAALEPLQHIAVTFFYESETAAHGFIKNGRR